MIPNFFSRGFFSPKYIFADSKWNNVFTIYGEIKTEQGIFLTETFRDFFDNYQNYQDYQKSRFSVLP